jgi:hypothetical protein
MFWNQLLLICMFFEEIHGMCKHHPIVVFHIFLGNVYILFEQYKIFKKLFSHSPIAMLPIYLFCQLPFSIMFPMFWFLVNARIGLVECHLLDIQIPIIVFLSYHIFYLICLRLTYIHSIIDSKVFGVTIGVNFLLAIVK